MAYLVQKFNSWNEAQVRCRYLLGITDEKIRCLPFRGPGHALIDMIYGLKEFWPTRKSIAVSPSGSALLQDSVRGLGLDGMTILKLRSEQGQSIDEWLEQIPKDLCVAVLVRDHCVTGEILTTDDKIAKLNERRIPHIEIQHGWAWSRSQLPLPFGIQIRVIDADKAIVVAGSRIKWIPHSAALMDWSHFEWEKSILECTIHHREARETIESFEKRLLVLEPGLRTLNLPTESRLFDRSLIFAEGVHGEYFIQEVLKNFSGLTSRPAGYEIRAETTNLGRWYGLHPWTWWGDVILSEAEQRSLVVFSASFVKQQLSPELLQKVYRQCLKKVKKTWESTNEV